MAGEAQPQGTGKALFFSYSHEDRAVAVRIIDALERRGFEVWWDDHVDGGTAYSGRIQTELSRADRVIVLWSPRSVASHWVIDEAQEGRDRGALVPLCIDGAVPPLGFRQIQTIDMSGWHGGEEDASFDRLMRALGAEADPGVAAAPLSPRRGPARRQVLAGAAAAAGIAGAGALGLAFWPRGPALREARSVAVLPFRNLSGDPQQDYLSAGISADVRLALARNAALKVVAQASSEAVRERALGAADMARELAVAVLLDGHVQYRDGRVRVATELIDGETGFTRWAQEFDRPVEETPMIRGAIANAVTRELSAGTVEAAGYGETSSAVAYDSYLKGRELYDAAISHETDLAALGHLEQATAQDPSFGAAFAALARTLTVLGNGARSVGEAKAYYARAHDAALAAVSAGPRSADAHSTLGYVLFQAQLKVRDAKEPYLRSFDLGQGEAPVLARYAAYAASTGDFGRARNAVARARDLDPLNAGVHRAVGFVAYAGGRFAESIASVERALELNPELSDSHARIALARLMLGEAEAAAEAAGKERSGLIGLPAKAIVAAALGDDEAADAHFGELVSRYGDSGLYQQAQVLARRGRPDEAMERLKKGQEAGDSGLTYVFIDPMLRSLGARDDFRRLILELGYA